jgi:hypothetical protein
MSVRYQAPSSFTPEEYIKIDAKMHELGLKSRYALIRYCVLKECGLAYVGSTREKTKNKIRTSIGKDRSTEPANRENIGSNIDELDEPAQ